MRCASMLGVIRPVHVVVPMKSTSAGVHPARSSAFRAAASLISSAPARKRACISSMDSSGRNVAGSM